MKSPITGKEMILQKEKRVLSFRKEEFNVVYHYYLCTDTGEQFEDDQLAELNLTQVYNQYRERLKLPFPDEIMAVRKKYGLSARKMSDILGFGPNTYGNYEKGEIPSKANARLTQLANDPEELKELAVYSENLTKTLDKRISELLETEKVLNFWNLDNLFKEKTQSSLNGYTMFKQEKVYQMILFFAEAIQPWKTKLNKLLFYADFLNFKKYGYSISGLKYAPIDYGPVPDEYELLFMFGRKNKIFKKAYQEINDDASGEKILPMKQAKFNNKLFEDNELETLNTILEKFRNVTSSEIVRMSHEEKAWIENYKRHPFIDYSYSFDLIHI
ncbi:MAG: DUF4065 domain-containing protein [Bacteroidales bacterium]|nr:DUF4065 domain-containing protein [Bacteroidales bacterium]